MKMLTLHQPWASLIAVGAKTIETRGWSTPYRGSVAIHAAAKRPLEGEEHGGWYWDWDFDHGIIVDFDGMSRDGSWHEFPAPLGAVVAVCDLVDVVPIAKFGVGMCERDYRPHVCLDPRCDSDALLYPGSVEPAHGDDITAQLPFGDFRVGRKAWLLGNVRPLTTPVPAKGHQGLRDVSYELAEQIDGAPA